MFGDIGRSNHSASVHTYEAVLGSGDIQIRGFAGKGMSERRVPEHSWQNSFVCEHDVLFTGLLHHCLKLFRFKRGLMPMEHAVAIRAHEHQILCLGRIAFLIVGDGFDVVAFNESFSALAICLREIKTANTATKIPLGCCSFL